MDDLRFDFDQMPSDPAFQPPATEFQRPQQDPRFRRPDDDQMERIRATLYNFVSTNPGHPDAEQARQQLARLPKIRTAASPLEGPEQAPPQALAARYLLGTGEP